MIFKAIIMSVLFMFTMLMIPGSVLACACCSEAGEYHNRTFKPDRTDLELLRTVRFGKEASLYLTEAGFDGVKGLSAPGGGSADYKLNGAEFNGTNWRLTFTDEDEKEGSLVLPLPTEMSLFKADIHDGRQSGGGGPLLYKELRFQGSVANGEGLFKAGIANPTTFSLVFQGRGNGCDNTEDFRTWRLEVKGRQANYAFFGLLSSGRTDELQPELDKSNENPEVDSRGIYSPTKTTTWTRLFANVLYENENLISRGVGHCDKSDSGILLGNNSVEKQRVTLINSNSEALFNW